MHCGVASLINKTYATDSIGNQTATETETVIYVTEQSLSRAEWVAAGRAGLNLQHLLVTPAINYSGQTEIEYENRRYSIYRTYQFGDDIELYCEAKGGVND